MGVDFPQEETVLKIKTLKNKINTYTVKVPNMGEFIDYQIIKAKLSEGQYQKMFSGTGGIDSSYAALTIDMMAAFTIMAPGLLEDMNVKGFTDLSLVDGKKLLTVYLKQFMPWWGEWQKFLNADDEEEEIESNIGQTSKTEKIVGES
jgi:hypothetical protein